MYVVVNMRNIRIIFTEGYRSGHNEAVLKTVWANAHVGSNPTPSAIKSLENTTFSRLLSFCRFSSLSIFRLEKAKHIWYNLK